MNSSVVVDTELSVFGLILNDAYSYEVEVAANEQCLTFMSFDATCKHRRTQNVSLNRRLSCLPITKPKKAILVENRSNQQMANDLRIVALESSSTSANSSYSRLSRDLMT